MSEQNVELHRRGVEAFIRDVKAFIALSDPQVELHSVYEAVGGADYHGHDGTRRFFSDLADTWEEIRVEPEAYFDFGENTLLYYLGRGRGRQSGAEVTMPLAQVCRWRDGLCFHWKTYVDRSDALRDLAVSTEALEPIAP